MHATRDPRRRRIVLASLAAAATGIALASIPPATATTSDSSQVRDGTLYTISVRATDGDAAALAERLIARGFDLLEARTGSVVFALGTTATASRLAGVSGAAVVGTVPAAPIGKVPPAPASQDSILPKRLDGKKYATYYGGYRTTGAYDAFETDLQAKYPNLVKKIQFGTTWTGRHPLNVVCVTADATHGCELTPNVDKPRFLFTAQIHARELGTSEMAWRYLTRLVDGWKTDAQMTSLLKSSEIWVVPQFNVDGIATVQKGIERDGTSSTSSAWQRKNLDDRQAPDGGCPPPWANSQIGVDMNRNWDSHWDTAGVSHYPCSEVFDGKAAASEREVKDGSALFRLLFKDQRGSGDDAAAPKNTIGAMVTMHSVAGMVLFPWGTSASLQTPNDAQLRSMAFRQSYYNGYQAGQPGQILYTVSGTTDDWTYDDLGIASFTWELNGAGACGGTFFPLYSCMDGYEANNLPGLVYDAAAARAPYKLGLGPTVTDVSAQVSGSDVTVKMTADDNAYGSSGVGRPAVQNVTAARIYVGKAPWNGGTAQAMRIKGSGSTVTASRIVKVGAKKVLAYVQGQDADGNWGPAMAVWIPAA